MKKYLLLALLAVGCTTTKTTERIVYTEKPQKLVRVVSAIDEMRLMRPDDDKRYILAFIIHDALPDTMRSILYRDSLVVLDKNFKSYYISNKVK